MAKQKTHEQYVEEVKRIHPDFEILSFYVNSKTKIKAKDLKCGFEFTVYPQSLLKESFMCPMCSNRKSTGKRATPLEKFLKLLKDTWGNLVEYVDSYTKMTKKCRFRCTVCGHIWKAKPSEIIHKKSGCPKCRYIRTARTRTTPLSEIIEQVTIMSEGTIEYVSGYVNTITKCLWRCTLCGKEWEACPHDILRKPRHGCPACSHKNAGLMKITPLEIVLEQVKIITNDTIEYLGGYIDKHHKCKWRCKICGNVWETVPDNILNGSGCPVCALKRRVEYRTYSLEKFLELLKKAWGDKIEYISGYVNMHTKCKFRCAICGHEWETMPGSLVNKNKSGCPLCAKYSLERPVMKALKEKGIIPLHNVALEGSNYNESLRPLRVDFIIETPEGKLAIETDGQQHFVPAYGEEELKIQQEHDRHKDKILKERGYILIRVTSSHTKKFSFKNHITLELLFKLIEKGINKETGKINFELFKKYDFNRE